LGDPSFNDGKVPAAGAVILELLLQAFLRFDCLRKDQESRCLTIEPMHDEDFFRRFLPAGAGAQRSVQRVFFFGVRRYVEKYRRLVDDQYGVIFKENAESIEVNWQDLKQPPRRA